MTPIFPLLAVLGLRFFFGLAFEELYRGEKRLRPGGIHTFACCRSPGLSSTGSTPSGWCRSAPGSFAALFVAISAATSWAKAAFARLEFSLSPRSSA
jgi:hypothetical protein